MFFKITHHSVLLTMPIFLSLGCTAPKPLDTGLDDTPTTYQAGMRDITFTDDRGKELLMTVWYPTIVTDGRSPDPYEPFTISINAYKATAPAVKNAPLIAFSHGFFAIRYQSAFLMEHLAEQGFVVVAVDHPFNTLYDFDDAKTAQVLLERPDDLRAAVDKLTEMVNTISDPFSDLADCSQYIAMGHSFGSHTATVLGGGTLDYDGLSTYCGNFPDERACDYFDNISASDLDQYGTVDSRVLATIPISPGLWYTFGANGEGLQTVQNPLIIAGIQDDVLEYETETQPFFEALSSPKTIFSMNNTGHYGMTNICDIASFLSEECADAGWQDVSAVQEATNDIISAFAKHHYWGIPFTPSTLVRDWIEVQSE